jgi:hypothetical protein
VLDEPPQPLVRARSGDEGLEPGAALAGRFRADDGVQGLEQRPRLGVGDAPVTERREGLRGDGRGREMRVTPVTRWPAASSSRTARRPTTPVPPVITMLVMSR